MSRPPSKGVWTDRYGPRVNPITHAKETHHGLDINAEAGTTLVAPESGVLASWGPLSGWSVQGNVAVINGDDGWVHWLAHTDRPLARVGARVAEGQPVAVMGMSGQTTGLHVHWETRFHGARLNPENWLAQTTTITPQPAPQPAPTSPEEDTMPPLRIAYFRGVPNATADTICVVNVTDHTFYRVASALQADFIKQTAKEKIIDIAGVQSFDLISGFREI